MGMSPNERPRYEIQHEDHIWDNQTERYLGIFGGPPEEIQRVCKLLNDEFQLRMQQAFYLDVLKLEDKVQGLESDLESAVERLWWTSGSDGISHRIWITLNYPKWAEKWRNGS